MFELMQLLVILACGVYVVSFGYAIFKGATGSYADDISPYRD